MDANTYEELIKRGHFANEPFKSTIEGGVASLEMFNRAPFRFPIHYHEVLAGPIDKTWTEEKK
jgi:hypothetical protein